MAMSSRSLRSEKPELQMRREAKATLRASAEAAHCSVSEIVLKGALARVGESLVDRRVFPLNATQWKTVLEALKAPARGLPRAESSQSRPGFFDGGARRRGEKSG
jgi:uncharacterized protein (DUF1778 family)